MLQWVSLYVYLSSSRSLPYSLILASVDSLLTDAAVRAVQREQGDKRALHSKRHTETDTPSAPRQGCIAYAWQTGPWPALELLIEQFALLSFIYELF